VKREVFWVERVRKTKGAMKSETKKNSNCHGDRAMYIRLFQRS